MKSRASRFSRQATRSPFGSSRWRREQIYDINRVHCLRGRSDNGGIPIPYSTAADTIDDLSRAVEECLEQDVMVFSGGSSVGETDPILDVVASKREMLFHGIAVKPGKPTAFSSHQGKRLFFGDAGLSNLLPLEVAHSPPCSLASPPCTSPGAGSCVGRTLTLPLSLAHPVRPGSAPVLIQSASRMPVAVPAFKASGHSRACRRPMDTSRFLPTRSVSNGGTPVQVTLF